MFSAICSFCKFQSNFAAAIWENNNTHVTVVYVYMYIEVSYLKISIEASYRKKY